MTPNVSLVRLSEHSFGIGNDGRKRGYRRIIDYGIPCVPPDQHVWYLWTVVRMAER